MEQAEYFQFLEEYHKQMLIQHTSEDTQTPSLRSCAGNFPAREFPGGLPDSSQGGDTVGKADPKFRFSFGTPHPSKHTDMGEDSLPTSGFCAGQIHT